MKVFSHTDFLDKKTFYIFYSRYKKGQGSFIQTAIFLGQWKRSGTVKNINHTGFLYYDDVAKDWVVSHSADTGLHLTSVKKFLEHRDIIKLHCYKEPRGNTNLNFELRQQFLKKLFIKYNGLPYDKISIINFISRALIKRNIIKSKKDDALFCSEWVCIVLRSIFTVDLVKILGVKSREFISPGMQMTALDKQEFVAINFLQS